MSRVTRIDRAALPASDLERLLGACPFGLALLGPDGRLCYVSSRLAGLFDVDERRTPGRPLSHLEPDLAAALAPHLNAILAGGSPGGTSMVYTLSRGPGPSRTLACTLFAVRGPDDRTVWAGLAVTPIEDAGESAAGRSEFRALLDAAREYAVIVLDLEGRVREWSEGARRILGYDRAEILGESVQRLYPPLPGEAGRPYKEMGICRVGGVADDENWLVGRGGRRFWASGQMSGVFTESGQIRGFVKIIRDLTEKKELSDRVLLLQRVALALANEEDLGGAFLVALREVCDFTGWTLGELWLPREDGSALELNQAWYSESDGLEVFRERSRAWSFPPNIGLPGQVWASGKPVWARDVRRREKDFRRGAEAEEAGLCAAMAVPVLAGEEVVAVLAFFLKEQRDEDARLLDLVAAVAAQVGSVVQRRRAEVARAELLRREQSVRARAEALQHRSEFLAQAGRVLVASLDYETTLPAVARLAVPLLGDLCIVDVAADSGTAPPIRRLAVVCADPEQEPLARTLEELPPDPAELIGVAGVLRTGVPALLRNIPDALAAMQLSEERRRAILAFDPRSAVVVPLPGRTRTLGAILAAHTGSGRRHTEEDLSLATELGRIAGLAVDNARLHQMQRRIAQSLQRSILPDHLPDVPWFEVAAEYRAAGEGIEVGGDFYDVIPVGETEWLALIGDVTGKGPEAAAVTARTRFTLHGAAQNRTDPGLLLGDLNRSLAAAEIGERWCTLACLHLVLAEDGIRVTAASAGHPLPLVRSSSGVAALGSPGPLLGAFERARYPEATATLAPGDAIVLYTDGVIEARGPEGEFGEQRLHALLEAAEGISAREIAERVRIAVLDFETGTPRDDLAVLAFRVVPRRPPDRAGSG